MSSRRRGPEAETQAAILQYLSLCGIFAWRQNTLPTPIVRSRNGVRAVLGFRPTSVRGVPDILGVLSGGRLLAIEVKSPKGKLSEQQSEFLRVLGERGALAFVARSVQDVIDKGVSR